MRFKFVITNLIRFVEKTKVKKRLILEKLLTCLSISNTPLMKNLLSYKTLCNNQIRIVLLTTFWCIALRWAVNKNLDLEVK